MSDWMMGGVNENDAEEARSEARRSPEPYDDRPSLSDLYDGPLDFPEGEEPDENDGWSHPEWCPFPPFHSPYFVKPVNGGWIVEMCEPEPSG